MRRGWGSAAAVVCVCWQRNAHMQRIQHGELVFRAPPVRRHASKHAASGCERCRAKLSIDCANRGEWQLLATVLSTRATCQAHHGARRAPPPAGTQAPSASVDHQNPCVRCAALYSHHFQSAVGVPNEPGLRDVKKLPTASWPTVPLQLAAPRPRCWQSQTYAPAEQRIGLRLVGPWP